MHRIQKDDADERLPNPNLAAIAHAQRRCMGRPLFRTIDESPAMVELLKNMLDLHKVRDACIRHSIQYRQLLAVICGNTTPCNEFFTKIEAAFRAKKEVLFPRDTYPWLYEKNSQLDDALATAEKQERRAASLPRHPAHFALEQADVGNICTDPQKKRAQRFAMRALHRSIDENGLEAINVPSCRKLAKAMIARFAPERVNEKQLLDDATQELLLIISKYSLSPSPSGVSKTLPAHIHIEIRRWLKQQYKKRTLSYERLIAPPLAEEMHDDMDEEVPPAWEPLINQVADTRDHDAREHESLHLLLREKLLDAIQVLTPREKKVLLASFGISEQESADLVEPKTLREIASTTQNLHKKTMGISREAVRHIITHAIAKIRKNKSAIEQLERMLCDISQGDDED